MKRPLAASVKYDDDNGLAKMTKEVSELEIQRLIYSYIEAEIICKKCGNPETVEDKKGRLKCRACGR
jgi:translation initiation factor 2 beta subunit (eIF-2beta)/eIF-5